MIVYLPCDEPPPVHRAVHHRHPHVVHHHAPQPCAVLGQGLTGVFGSAAFHPAAVMASPEPATWLMLLLAAVALGVFRPRPE